MFFEARQRGWADDYDEIAAQYCHGDGAYWRCNERGAWISANAEQMRRELRVKFGIPTRGTSCDRILHAIETRHHIAGIAAFLYRPTGRIVHGDTTYLNTSTVKTVEPLPGKREWGEGFPGIARLLDGMFEGRGKEHVLDWLAHAVKTAHAGRIKKGTVLILAGPPGCGKTLFSTCLVKTLMGGGADASAYLLGETRFNGDLSSAPVWTIDDCLAGSDRNSHDRFSNMLKKVAANHEFSMETKFRTPVNIPWLGRVIITTNEDARSLSILPNMDLSNRDKISLVRLRDGAPVVADANADKKIKQELPAFAGFLLGWEIKADGRRDPRFGVRAFHDPELLAAARQAGETQPFLEMVQEWRTFYFKSDEDARRAGYVELTAAGLLNLMREPLSPVARATTGLSNVTVGRQMKQIMAEGCDWVGQRRLRGGTRYRINAPNNEE